MSPPSDRDEAWWASLTRLPHTFESPNLTNGSARENGLGTVRPARDWGWGGPISIVRAITQASLEKGEIVARDKVVLAYSGGLDTSVAVKWINETYGLDVIAYTCDLGQGQDIHAIREKALKTGAVEAIAEDVRNLFVDYFAFPSLMAGALYEGKYPLATALGRPLIAQLMCRVAKEHGAVAVAHGCTGKGNDQVRFDVTFHGRSCPHLGSSPRSASGNGPGPRRLAIRGRPRH